MTDTGPVPQLFHIGEYHDTYPHARQRGFVPWTPRRDTAAVLAQVDQVLAEYRDHWPLTLRQVFYRLVGHHGYDKTEKAYKRLGEYMNRARRAQLIPWHAIRDDGERVYRPGGYDNADDWFDTIEQSAEGFYLDPRQGQNRSGVFLVEAAGMVPQVDRVARRYGFEVRSSGGFNSVTVTNALAQRIAADDRDTVVLHIGDYDPSGESVFDSLAADVSLFVAGYGRAGAAEFYRVAVTEEQVEHFDLPSAPAKTTDVRGDWHTEKLDATQAEAFAPDVLADIVRAACELFTDLDTLRETRTRGRDVARELGGAVEKMRERWVYDHDEEE